MSPTREIAGRTIGEGHPTYVIAEIGINHNGSLEIAKRLIAMAKAVGCDAVKFQKRNPEKCVPADQRDQMRETPWGYISYMEYRHKVEFGEDDFRQIDQILQGARHRLVRVVLGHRLGRLHQVLSGRRASRFPRRASRIASCSSIAAAPGVPLILSTGMSTLEQIDAAVSILGTDRLLLAHCTSTYPCPNEELNLRMIPKLRELYACPVGYSGHEVGLATSLAAVALGACFVERHITLDRAMWGSDQAASVEPIGMGRLIKDIRAIEAALGDGIKRVYESERKAASRLRLRDTL